MAANAQRRRTRKAGRCERGSAALEFAITAPVLIMLLLGIGDVAVTSIAKVNSSNATASAADLATQSVNLQTSDMVDIFAGAADVMAPLSSNALVLRITSFSSDGNGSFFVHWSCGQGALAPFAAKSTVTTLPTGDSPWYIGNGLNHSDAYGYHVGTNTTYIQVESQYIFTAPTQFLIKGAQTMRGVFFVYPRQSTYVGFPWDGNVNDQPTAPVSTTKTASTTLSNGATCNYAY